MSKNVEAQWWSVPQAIVWIVSGSETSVENARDLITIASLRQLALLPISTGEGPPLSLDDARNELMRAARAEEIRISGQRPGGRQEPIPASALKVSGLLDLNGLNECLPCVMEPRQRLQPDSGRHWLRLWIRADECMIRWPASASAAATTSKDNERLPKPTAERMGSWYRQRVADHDPSQPPPTRPEDEKAAKVYFKCGGLKDLVREARNKYAPAQWKESGPKGRKVKAHAARAIATQSGPK